MSDRSYLGGVPELVASSDICRWFIRICLKGYTLKSLLCLSNFKCSARYGVHSMLIPVKRHTLAAVMVWSSCSAPGVVVVFGKCRQTKSLREDVSSQVIICVPGVCIRKHSSLTFMVIQILNAKSIDRLRDFSSAERNWWSNKDRISGLLNSVLKESVRTRTRISACVVAAIVEISHVSSRFPRRSLLHSVE